MHNSSLKLDAKYTAYATVEAAVPYAYLQLVGTKSY